MTRTTIKTTATLLVAVCLAAVALVLASAPQAHAAGAKVTLTVISDSETSALGKANVVEGADGSAKLEGVQAGAGKTLTLEDVYSGDGGKIDFITEAVDRHAYIESIYVTYEGNRILFASSKQDGCQGFYEQDPGLMVFSSECTLRSGNFGSNPYKDASGESLGGYTRSSTFNFYDIQGDITIEVTYALMETHALTFNSGFGDSGSSVLKTRTVYSGDWLGAAPSVPVREGYTFLGWATAPNGTPAKWDEKQIMGFDDLNFYAVWQKDGGLTPPEEEVVAPSDDDPKDDAEAKGPGSQKGSAPALADTGDSMTSVAAVAGLAAAASALVAVMALTRAKFSKQRNSTRLR